MCDRGSCGACTVIIAGRTYYSCSLLAIEAQGSNIRTVEGLAQGTTLHPVQQSFCDHDALMCGFCTPGFVMSTVALLEQTPRPTAEQAKHGLDGNICRCGTNIGVLAAALGSAAPGASGASPASSASSASSASTAAHPKYAWPEKSRLLGTRINRLDGPLKATGRAKYMFDITRPGMIFGKIM